jgi:MFS family permease
MYFVVYATKVLSLTLDQWAIASAFRYLSIAIPGIIAGFSIDAFGRKRFLILAICCLSRDAALHKRRL